MNPGTVRYPFDEKEMQAAHDAWGCNCGPSALAWALQVPLARVRGSIPGFEQKRYTSPTMMKAALELVARPYVAVRQPLGKPPAIEKMFDERMALVRIQWAGPWTEPGANPRWAYRQTHWIATWEERGVPLLFDCNGGMRGPDSWEAEIVPILTALYPRANGEWFPTHIWRLV